MRKFKNHYEVSKMNVKELLSYAQQLRSTIQEIRREVVAVYQIQESVNTELAYQMYKMGLQISKLENIRSNADTVKEWASLDLN